MAFDCFIASAENKTAVSMGQRQRIDIGKFLFFSSAMAARAVVTL